MMYPPWYIRISSTTAMRPANASWLASRGLLNFQECKKSSSAARPTILTLSPLENFARPWKGPGIVITAPPDHGGVRTHVAAGVLVLSRNCAAPPLVAPSGWRFDNRVWNVVDHPPLPGSISSRLSTSEAFMPPTWAGVVTCEPAHNSFPAPTMIAIVLALGNWGTRYLFLNRVLCPRNSCVPIIPALARLVDCSLEIANARRARREPRLGNPA